MPIARDPDVASRRDYDLIVVGGGIYGVMLALEATLRDCSVLLLEKEDFGGATSYNSLRIIHGGLRDLKTFDLRRYWRFGRERRWFLDHFPHLVERLPVLVPLYQRGLMRTEVFRLAFWVDRLLLPRRDRRGEGGRHIPYGQVLSPSEVKQRFPAVDEEHLAGGALWYDARVPDSQRLIMEVLRSACRMGATALNYMPAVDLLTDRGRVAGVQARDHRAGTSYRFRADRVVNAAGPWSPEVARSFDQELAEFCGSLSAWNVLFDRETPTDCAVGAAPPESGNRHYFLHPWKGRLLMGTGHATREGSDTSPRPTPDEMDAFLDELNKAFPALGLSRREVLNVYSGALPVKQEEATTLAKTDRWIDHAKHGGPEGLFSVQGTKFTAARSTAERGVARIFPKRAVSEEKRSVFRSCRTGQSTPRGIFDDHWEPASDDLTGWESLVQIVQEEAVVHLDDLILRRTSLGDNPARALQVAPQLCDLFDWGPGRCQKEVRRVAEHFSHVRNRSESNADVSTHDIPPPHE
jgi:glycerol-3-phosphate dehydrogenase